MIKNVYAVYFKLMGKLPTAPSPQNVMIKPTRVADHLLYLCSVAVYQHEYVHPDQSTLNATAADGNRNLLITI